MRTLQRLQKTARRARELAAEFRTDLPLRDALMAYAVEVEVQVREFLSSGRSVAPGVEDGGDQTLSDAAPPSEYWQRECAFLRERMLAFSPGNGRRRILKALADDCDRLAQMLASRGK